MPDYIVLDQTILTLVGTAGFFWLIAVALVRSKRQKILQGEASKLSDNAAGLAFYRVLRSVSGLIFFAGIIVLLFLMAANFWIASAAIPGDRLEQLVSYRDQIETAIDRSTLASSLTWVAALLLLALIWMFTARSRSSSNWRNAIAARKETLQAAFSGLDDAELLNQAGTNSDEIKRRLESKISKLRSANQTKLERARSVPVVKFDGMDAPLSLTGVSQLKTVILNDIKQLRAIGAGADEIEKLREAAANLDKLSQEIEKEHRVQFSRLDGTSLELPITEALQTWEPSQEERTSALRNLCVEAKLDAHAELGRSAPRREAELMSERLGTAITSEGAVKLGSATGRLAATLAAVLIFVGFFGFGAHSAGTSLVDVSKRAEFTLISNRDSAELEQALIASAEQSSSASETNTNSGVLDDGQLASDEETEEFLRQSFRSEVSRQFTAGLSASQRTVSFGARAAQARQLILASSGRQAAIPLDRGVARQTISARGTSATPRAATVYDRAIDRRITQLRSSPSVWNRLRAQANRPTTTRLASDAFFNTIFAGPDRVSTRALEVHASRTSAEFASKVATSGSVDGVTLRSGSAPEVPLPITQREQRLIRDFRASVPERYAAHANGLGGGTADPGSLHRVTATSGARAAPYLSLIHI